MLILLAEDDLNIAKLLIHLLRKEGFQVDHAHDGNEALMYCERNTYDVIILDWMMPHKSGVEVLRIIRQQSYGGGVLMLTAKDTLEDRIEGLDNGADDYLGKPFEFRELLARVKALGRRSSKLIQEDSQTIGGFVLDRQHKCIYYGTADLNLTNREFQVFRLLLENNRQVVTREVLIDRVWGIDQEISNNNVDAFIRLLRKKVEAVTGKKVIVNVRAIGYKVEV